jgi:hypothetical protein
MCHCRPCTRYLDDLVPYLSTSNDGACSRSGNVQILKQSGLFRAVGITDEYTVPCTRRKAFTDDIEMRFRADPQGYAKGLLLEV